MTEALAVARSTLMPARWSSDTWPKYDAVHLACALALNEPLVDSGQPPLIFVAADEDLLAAAAEGLATDNPNDHP